MQNAFWADKGTVSMLAILDGGTVALFMEAFASPTPAILIMAVLRITRHFGRRLKVGLATGVLCC